MNDDGKPHDQCGVFGIFAPKEDVATLSFYGLSALQHRGQESAGIASADYKRLKLHKGMGLVNQVFNEDILNNLDGKLAVGHTRYSTEGASCIENAQPTVLDSQFGEFALVHNGNLANYDELKKKLLEKGHCFHAEVDSELISRIIIEAQGNSLKTKIINGIAQIKGAYCLVFLTKDKLYVVRDQWGIRPLWLGKINSSGWLVASESVAIEALGGEVIREVKPGEFIEISKKGIETFHQTKNKKGGFCIFEYVYFSRPDSVINGHLVYETRFRAGEILAKEHPVEADLVMSVPDSGTAAALGYAKESNITFHEGLIKSRYVGRTFIKPNQKLRSLGVGMKFNTLNKILKNKIVVLVDDSVVRGTTISQIIKMLKEAKVKEVHLRVASPPFRHICYLGVDIGRYSELIANKHSLEQIRKEVKADTMGYLSLDGLKKSVGKIEHGVCTGCFNKNYPVLRETLVRKRQNK